MGYNGGLMWRGAMRTWMAAALTGNPSAYALNKECKSQKQLLDNSSVRPSLVQRFQQDCGGVS